MDAVLAKLLNEKSVTSVSNTGTKLDAGKVDLTHLRLDALTPIARVFEFGAKKYSRGNYLGGMSHTRLLAAAMRHLMSYIAGENLDIESGESHLAHLGCCILMLLTYKAQGLGTDDRTLLDKQQPAK